jgi:hypothetical protein
MSIYDLIYRTDTPGGGLAPTSETFDMFKRLLSPDEYNELGQGNKMMFGNYMDYVAQFQKIQKSQNRTGTPGTQRTPQGGNWSVAGVGEPISTASNRQGTTGKGGAAIPPYKTFTDITGKVQFQHAGGKQTIEGNYIPTSLEDVQNSATLDYIVPKMQATAEADYLTQLNNLAMQKTYASQNKAQMAQERLRQQGVSSEQSVIKNQITQQSNLDKNTRYYDGLDHKEKMATLQGDIRKGLLERTYQLKGIDNLQRDELKTINEYLVGNVPGSQQAIIKNKEYAQRAMEIANNAFSNAVKMEDKKEAEQLREDIRNHISRLDILESSVYGNAKTNIQGKMKASQEQLNNLPTGQPTTQPPPNAKQGKDGKWYVQQNGKWFLWQP